MRTPTRAVLTVLAALLLAVCVGCAPAHLPPLGAGPYVASDRIELIDAVRAAQSAGYHPSEIDPAHGRFVVQSRRMLRGDVRFVVRLTTELIVVIVPEGTHIRLVRGQFQMPRVIATEYAQFAQAMENGLGTRVGLR